MNKNFVKNFLKLVRWPNLLIIIATQYFAAYSLIGSQSIQRLFEDVNLFLLSISTILIAAGGYIINDYYDIKIDYINRPERVVAGRFLKRRTILVLHSTVTTIGILLGFFVSWQIGLVNFFAAGLLWLYSNQLKRMPLLGNISIAFLTGLAVLVVYILFKEAVFLFSAYAFFAFFISLIREIIKDMEDIEGDSKFDCKTLPIVLGQRRTKLVIYLIVIIFIIVVAILLQREPKFWYVLGGLTLLLSWLVYKLARADKVKDFAKLSLLSKQIMILGLLSMIFLK